MVEIVNKVAQSGLITLNLEDFYDATEIVTYDIKENLFQGLILREKDFRAFVKEHDWSTYSGKHVAVLCSVDAIVPTWAYMIISNSLEPYAKSIFFGDATALQQSLIAKKMANVNWAEYEDKRVVIKGCGDIDIPVGAYIEATKELTKVAKSIMYGEPCSTVPIFKRKA